MELLIIICLSLLMIPITLLTSGMLRIILGLFFMLFLPGYCLVTVMFPRKGNIRGSERILMSFGLSIVIVTFLGLILNYSPLPMGLETVLFSVLGFIIITGGLAALRRYRLPKDTRFSVDFSIVRLRISQLRGGRSYLSLALIILLVVVITGTVANLIYSVQSTKPEAKFTEFQIISPNGVMDNYPGDVQVGEELQVVVEINNREYDSFDYYLEIEIDGQNLKKLGPITLGHGQSWRQEVSFTPIRAGIDQKVNLNLLKNNNETEYSLFFWIDVRER